MPLADFTHLPTRCQFIAMMPQWDFLNFLAAQARALPDFTLRMQAEVDGVSSRRTDASSGVVATTPDGPLEIRADLVVGADGRRSVVRERAGLRVDGSRRADGRAVVPHVARAPTIRSDIRPATSVPATCS